MEELQRKLWIADTLQPRVRVRVKADALAEAKPVTRRRVAATEQKEEPRPVGELTSWNIEKPAVGLWDVTDHRTGRMLERWWFTGVWWVMGPQPDSRTVARLTHDQFVASYAWRGLASKPLEKYPCPPYDLRTLPPGCELEVATSLPGFVPGAARRRVVTAPDA